jgi:hypothetical protein
MHLSIDNPSKRVLLAELGDVRVDVEDAVEDWLGVRVIWDQRCTPIG